MGLFFITGVKFTRKSPQNAFNVGYRFQFWKVSERCKTMDPFPHTGIYLQKMELQWMMSFSSQTIRIPLNHNFFFFFACHMNNIKLSFKENNQFTLFFFPFADSLLRPQWGLRPPQTEEMNWYCIIPQDLYRHIRLSTVYIQNKTLGFK